MNSGCPRAGCYPPFFLLSALYTHFLGVDISKDTLDIALVSPHKTLLYEKRIANKKAVILGLFKQLRRLVPDFAPATALVCMEHTGLNNRPLLAAVQALVLPAWVEHAAHLNAATGLRRSETDAVDARRIAAYAARFADRVMTKIMRLPLVEP